MIFSSRALISEASQKKLSRSWTHSKYETVTPPALARMSGTTLTPRSCRIASAPGVVGALAPSTTMRARTLPALRSLIAPASAQGARISQSTSKSASRAIASPAGKPATEPVSST